MTERAKIVAWVIVFTVFYATVVWTCWAAYTEKRAPELRSCWTDWRGDSLFVYVVPHVIDGTPVLPRYVRVRYVRIHADN